MPVCADSACAWVHACVCMSVCAQACINSLQSGWLCSQTALSGCIATDSPHSPPSPSLLLCERLNLQCNLKIFSTLSHTHLRHHSVCVRVCLRLLVCVCYVCLLSMDSTEPKHMKEEKRGRSPPPSSAVSPTERDGELKSSLQFSFTLWLNIDVFTLNISEGFKVCTALLQSLSYLLQLSLSFSSFILYFPFFPFILSLSLSHKVSASTAKWEFCMSSQSHYPPPPTPHLPPSPPHSTLWPR